MSSIFEMYIYEECNTSNIINRIISENSYQIFDLFLEIKQLT